MKYTLGRIRSLQAASLIACAAAMTASALVPAAPVRAQDSQAQAESRMRRMESEIRALQRQVFPGGDGKFFGPEIAPTPTASGATPAGPPASTPVTDLLARMEALEAQLARLTAQTEVNSNKIAQIEAKLAPPTVDAGVAPVATASGTPDMATTTTGNLSAMTGGASTPAPPPTPAPRPAATPTSAPRLTASAPSAKRVAAVRAIEKPSTGDAGKDEYDYGFRLWDAKFYPEAQQQLKLMIDKYPRADQISHARNLLGRAYLDDGKPRDAATWFLQNYQTDKAGARAPDSLLFLAESMRRLNDKNRACIALSEFAATYAAEAAGRLKVQYDATRAPLKCT